MGPHDIVRILDCTVECSCGGTFSGSSVEVAKRNHGYHRGLAMARAALPDDEEGA